MDKLGALEWHWSTDSEYINFLAVGALGAEILSPEFPNFGRNSKMAASMGAAMMTKQKKNFFLRIYICFRWFELTLTPPIAIAIANL